VYEQAQVVPTASLSTRPIYIRLQDGLRRFFACPQRRCKPARGAQYAPVCVAPGAWAARSGCTVRMLKSVGL